MVIIIAPMASIIPFSEGIKLWCFNQFNNTWTKIDRKICSTVLSYSKLNSLEFFTIQY